MSDYATLLLQILQWLRVKAKDLHVALRPSGGLASPYLQDFIVHSPLTPLGSSNTAGCFHEPTILSAGNNELVCFRSHQLCLPRLTYQDTEHSFLRNPQHYRHLYLLPAISTSEVGIQSELLAALTPLGLEERAPLMLRCSMGW